MARLTDAALKHFALLYLAEDLADGKIHASSPTLSLPPLTKDEVPRLRLLAEQALK